MMMVNNLNVPNISKRWKYRLDLKAMEWYEKLHGLGAVSIYIYL